MWLNGDLHKGNKEKLFSSLLLLEIRYTESECGTKDGVREKVIYSDERESPLPARLLSPHPPNHPPPLLKASYISANDLRSFPDLASAIQRIMNNALTLKLQK